MTALVVVNPYSGRGRAGRALARLRQLFSTSGLEAEWQPTTAPGDAIEIARNALQAGFTPIIAAGGDGLISEVVNGMFRARPDEPLGPLAVVPLGTANDLAHNLGLPLDLAGAVRAIRTGSVRNIDLGKAGDWVFHNNSAIGLEPMVTIHNERMVRLRGTIRYLVAALLAIAEKGEWHATLRWDNGEYRGPMSLVSVGNNPVTGGLFRMAPLADPFDGRLTFVHAFAPTRRRMLQLLPRTLNGSYTDSPDAHQHHTRRLSVQIEPGTPLQVDGEIRSRDLDSIEYSVLPSRLKLLFPSETDPKE